MNCKKSTERGLATGETSYAADSPPDSLPALHRLIWTALLAACMAVGAGVHFPLGPIPISLQTLFVFLAGYLLGPRHGVACVLLYLGAGLLGLPVFAGGHSGPAQLLGPTGGYLVGFLAAAWATGMASRNGAAISWTRGLLWGAIGLAMLYALGMLRLKAVLDLNYAKAFWIGIVPFFPGDALKLFTALTCSRVLHKHRLLPR